MKKYVLIAILGILFLPCWVGASEIPDFPFVFVSGRAETEVVPDFATVTFRVEAFDINPDKALSVVEKRSNELVSIFNRFGIEKKDIMAFEVNKETVRQTKDYVKLGILGYEVTRPISLTIRKLDKFDTIMTQLLNLKNITNIHTGFDTSKRKEIEAELMKQAAQKAREQAEFLSKGFGSEISGVHAISVSPEDFGNLGVAFGLGRGYGAQYSLSSRTKMEESVTVFVPNTIKIEKVVNAIFRLK